jgi:deazaflavin-dependent oxidoreductase (nitroreductase family)
MLTEINPDPILLLKTYDRQSGKLITHPVFYRSHQNGFVVAASNETDPYKPDWYLNLKEEPIVEIEVQGMDQFAVASTPVGAERMEIWPLIEQLSADVERQLPRNVTGVLLIPM